MARSNKFDDLDEMLVPQDVSGDDAAEPAKRKKDKAAKAPTKQTDGVPPYIAAKQAKRRAETRNLIITGVIIFVLLVGILIGVGFLMGKRAGVDYSASKPSADRSRTQFHNEKALPDLSAEGVKGTLTEAYFTKKGDLSLTFSLSNGTAVEHELVNMDVRIFNGDQQDVARQVFSKFRPAVRVPAGGYGSVSVVVDKDNVLLPDDSLETLGTTLQIGSKPLKEEEEEHTPEGDGPKDIAVGRTYFEALGNMPALSAEGVKGTVIRAKYTNDGSLAVTLSLSNGMDAAQQVTTVNVDIKNGDGAQIAQQEITTFETPCIVQSKSYNELDIILDTANVVLKDDPLSTLTCTVSVGTGPVANDSATTTEDLSEKESVNSLKDDTASEEAAIPESE